MANTQQSKMISLLFSPISEHDLPLVLDIYNYYVEHTTASFQIGKISVGQLSEIVFIDHPVYKSYLIKNDDEVCGYCFLSQFRKREAYNRTAEVTVYLKPQYSGKGIGKPAVEFLEQAAKDSGIKALVAVISGDNVPSIRFFEKQGYVKCAHYKRVGEKFGKILDVVSYQKML